MRTTLHCVYNVYMVTQQTVLCNYTLMLGGFEIKVKLWDENYISVYWLNAIKIAILNEVDGYST